MATNKKHLDSIKYGKALIFACLQKKQIKGVKVSITMSLEVKIVRMATKK